MNNLFKIAKSAIKLLKMSGLKSYKVLDIPKIPDVWSKFLDSDSKWVKINLPRKENNLTCLFKAKAGSILPPHSHPFFEQVSVLEGKLNVITKTNEYEVSKPNGCFFETDEIHAVEFLEDSELLIIWGTKDPNYVASFEEDEEAEIK